MLPTYERQKMREKIICSERLMTVAVPAVLGNVALTC